MKYLTDATGPKKRGIIGMDSGTQADDDVVNADGSYAVKYDGNEKFQTGDGSSGYFAKSEKTEDEML